MKTSKIILCCLLTFLIFGSAFPQSASKEITVKDVYKTGLFDARGSRVQSMKDGSHYTVLEKGSAVVKYRYQDGKKVETILDVSKTDFGSISGYAFSGDESKLLLTTEAERYFPRGTQAQFYVWDSKTNAIKPISRDGKQRLAEFSPDGTKVAFVRDNNLYIKDLEKDQENEITNDGKYNEIINGAADYTYYEFGLAPAFAWSPDSSQLAYWHFDEREVPLVNITMFFDLYPDNYTYKFTKPGENNAVVEIFAYHVKTGAARKMDIGPEKDQYIPRIKWTPDSQTLCITRMNRHQNHLELLFADPATGKSRVGFTETNKYWIDIHDDLTFLPDNQHFIWTSEQDGFNHIYLYTTAGKLVRQVTKGKWDVKRYLGYNPKTQTLYYTTSETTPLQSDVFAIKINGKNKKKLSTLSGQNTATFSSSFAYYVNTHSDANTPPTTAVYDAKGTRLFVLEDNAQLKVRMKDYGFVKKEFLTFTTSDGVTLNAWMMKPKDFDPGKKYPVLMYEYGGPGAGTVSNGWDRSFGWYQLLCQKGIIVFSLDARGSGGRGQEFKKATYLNLGKWETHDNIEGAKYLGALPYIDANRIGIHGGSYGGYMAAMCILKGADVFSLSVSSKPVTHWKYYDSIYTERYMRTPQENPEGYKESAPITWVDKLKGKLLLLHGSADDNVHVQHSWMFNEALIEADKQFDMHFYTNKNHGYNHDRSGNTRYHLHVKITDFILNNL